MSTSRNHARHQGARAAGSAPAEGLQDPRKMNVVFRRDGWTDPIGHGHFTLVFDKIDTHRGPVLWTSFQTPVFHLARPAYMMLLQGMPLGQLFDSGTWSDAGENVRGPFVLLRWENTALWAGVPRLERLLLGHVIDAPKMTPQELVGVLLPRAGLY